MNLNIKLIDKILNKQYKPDSLGTKLKEKGIIVSEIVNRLKKGKSEREIINEFNDIKNEKIENFETFITEKTKWSKSINDNSSELQKILVDFDKRLKKLENN